MTVETATLAGGCFWCTEAVFNDVIGVSKVESGYIGGTVPNPTYKQVCGGDTGHAEAIRVTFDTDQISYGEIARHLPRHARSDPAQPPGQRRRHPISLGDLPAFPEQEAEAYAAIERARPDWPQPIVTTIEPLSDWYPAEDYHQEYWQGEGQRNPYCLAVIPPKLRKLRKSFANRLKEGAAA
jgi:peptide-methionine (S)-S-oxide reductase